jgi:CMP-N-acetylneuraminic acid synthetase
LTGTDKKIVAVIPARGNSTRIPKKNIIDFMGKPMIAWTIEAAMKTGIFDKIIVSTDNEEIAKISLEFGAEVPFLRMNKADDFSPVSEATIETLKLLEKAGYYFDEVIQLFAVCPLRNSHDIVDAYNFFLQKNKPFLISCFKYAWMNPWWAITLNDENEGNWIFQETKKRSQDLPELYCPTGAVWIANIKELYKEGSFYGAKHIFWEMDWRRAIDIDNFEDIDLAKTLIKLK